MNVSGPCKAKGTSVTSDDWDAKCVINLCTKGEAEKGEGGVGEDGRRTKQE